MMLINMLVSLYNLQPNLTCSISFVDFRQVISQWDIAGVRITKNKQNKHLGPIENIAINFLTFENLKE